MSEGAAHTYFRHDGINLLEIAKSDGTLTKLTHGYTPTTGIGSVVEVDIDGTTYCFHQGPRGTPYKITDANENLVWTGLCDAWGRALSETGTNPTIFWYQGQAWFKLTVGPRTYYISPTRIYDPEDGRFVQRDRDPRLSRNAPRADLARYIYMHNRPIHGVDPGGLHATGSSWHNFLHEMAYYSDTHRGKTEPYEGSAYEFIFEENPNMNLFCAGIKLIATRNTTKCLCGIAGVADIFSAVPALEIFDCGCNILTSVDMFCTRGWRDAKMAGYTVLTIMDCSSVKIGDKVADLTKGKPSKEAAGLVADVIAVGFQNLLTQTPPGPFHVDQAKACCEVLKGNL